MIEIYNDWPNSVKELAEQINSQVRVQRIVNNYKRYEIQ